MSTITEWSVLILDYSKKNVSLHNSKKHVNTLEMKDLMKSNNHNELINFANIIIIFLKHFTDKSNVDSCTKTTPIQKLIKHSINLVVFFQP